MTIVDYEEVDKNLNRLKREAEQNDNWALIHYVTEFQNKFDEIKQPEMRDMPEFRKQMYHELSYLDKKIKQYIKKQNFKTNKFIVYAPEFENQNSNLLFVSLHKFFEINNELICKLNQQIINKIFFPKYYKSFGQSFIENNYNPLQDLYYKSNFDSILLENLKKHPDRVSSASTELDQIIIKSQYFDKNVMKNSIYDRLNEGDNEYEIKIDVF